MYEKRFENQVAIVTGGASGLGKVVAERLAREGACVTLFDLNPDQLASTRTEFEGLGLKVNTHGLDVGDDKAVYDATRSVVDRDGRLDVVVHCAGIVGPNGRKITDVGVDEFDAVCRVNLRGSFLITKHAIPHMQVNDYGRVLLFASVAGKEGNAGMCCYSSSKAGVIGLTKSVGKEFAGTGITVNAIAPAVIKTDMVAAMDPAQVKYMTDKIPAGRCGTLEEVAALSCWIVSQEASYNTAFTFDLTGGRATY